MIFTLTPKGSSPATAALFNTTTRWHRAPNRTLSITTLLCRNQSVSPQIQQPGAFVCSKPNAAVRERHSTRAHIPSQLLLRYTETNTGGTVKKSTTEFTSSQNHSLSLAAMNYRGIEQTEQNSFLSLICDRPSITLSESQSQTLKIHESTS